MVGLTDRPDIPTAVVLLCTLPSAIRDRRSTSITSSNDIETRLAIQCV